MKLTIDTTPEQDAAIVAHHAILAPEVPLDQFILAGIQLRINDIVAWYIDQKVRNLVQAYKDAEPAARSSVDDALDLVRKSSEAIAIAVDAMKPPNG